MLVGKFGPEILHGPRGSAISTAGDTRRLLGGSGQQAQRVQVSVSPSPYFDVAVREAVAPDIQNGMALAAPQGAAGGAQMGEAAMATRGRRQLGRRW